MTVQASLCQTWWEPKLLVFSHTVSSIPQDARAAFRQTLSETTHKLDAIARKLGSVVEKARPYYDARFRAKEVRT